MFKNYTEVWKTNNTTLANISNTEGQHSLFLMWAIRHTPRENGWKFESKAVVSTTPRACEGEPTPAKAISLILGITEHAWGQEEGNRKDAYAPWCTNLDPRENPAETRVKPILGSGRYLSASNSPHYLSKSLPSQSHTCKCIGLFWFFYRVRALAQAQITFCSLFSFPSSCINMTEKYNLQAVYGGKHIRRVKYQYCVPSTVANICLNQQWETENCW